MEDKEAVADSKLHPKWKFKEGRGGFKAAMFIFALTAFENMSFIANMTSMVLYCIYVMYFNVPESSNTVTNFLGTAFLLALIGGFISDTYLTRLNTVLIFGIIEVLALMLITVQAHYKKLQPEECSHPPCIKGGQAFMFYASLYLLALGSGGVRGSLPALGGDQFDENDPKEKNALASFFNWLVLSVTLGATIGVTFIVYLSTDQGWDIGFFTCTLACFVGFVFVALGKPYYRVKPPGYSPIIQITEVIVVALRNRSLSLPEDNDELHETSDKETSPDGKIPHTHQFRLLDKAAILRQDTAPEQLKVCTVTQVEEVKILIRMLPIIASTIIMNTCLAQLQTVSVQQGNKMNRYLGSLEVPAPSIPVIPLVFMSILIPIYEFFFVPFARKITNHPSGITQLQRVGVGLFLSAISMAIAGFVEVKRRNQALKDPTHPISLFWLSFQYGIFGIADMFTLVGLMDFFYKEAPSGMKSLSTSFTFLSLSMGYFLSSVLVEIVNFTTGKLEKSKRGWLQGEGLNDMKLDFFYWFLAVLSGVNFANYIFCAMWYKYKTDDPNLELKVKASPGSSFHKDRSMDVVARRDSSSFPEPAEVNGVEPSIESAVHKEETVDNNEAKRNSASSPDHKEVSKDNEEERNVDK